MAGSWLEKQLRSIGRVLLPTRHTRQLLYITDQVSSLTRVATLPTTTTFKVVGLEMVQDGVYVITTL